MPNNNPLSPAERADLHNRLRIKLYGQTPDEFAAGLIDGLVQPEPTIPRPTPEESRAYPNNEAERQQKRTAGGDA